MITRAAISIALVWMCLPHHPDLGLPAAADSCTGEACVTVSAGDIERETIFHRLREVRNEIRASKSGLAVANSGVNDGGKVASLNAGDMSGLIARLGGAANALTGERR